MVTDREAREWTSLRRVIDITLRVGYGEESPLRRADIVDEILKGVSNYRNFIRAERDAVWSAAAEEMVAALNELQQIPTITLLTPGRIIKARDALNALIKEVKPCGS